MPHLAAQYRHSQSAAEAAAAAAVAAVAEGGGRGGSNSSDNNRSCWALPAPHTARQQQQQQLLDNSVFLPPQLATAPPHAPTPEDGFIPAMHHPLPPSYHPQVHSRLLPRPEIVAPPPAPHAHYAGGSGNGFYQPNPATLSNPPVSPRPAAFWQQQQQLPALDPSVSPSAAMAAAAHGFAGGPPLGMPCCSYPGPHRHVSEHLHARSTNENPPANAFTPVVAPFPFTDPAVRSNESALHVQLQQPNDGQTQTAFKHLKKKQTAPLQLQPTKSIKKSVPRSAPKEKSAGAAKERLFKCDVNDCSKTFTTAGHLVRHIKSHSGERPFSCPIPGCLSTFTRHDNMMQHKRIHQRKLDDAHHKALPSPNELPAASLSSSSSAPSTSDQYFSSPGNAAAAAAAADSETMHNRNIKSEAAASSESIDRILRPPALPDFERRSTAGARASTPSQQPHSSVFNDYSASSTLYPYDRGPLFRDTPSPLSGIYFSSRGPPEIQLQQAQPSSSSPPPPFDAVNAHAETRMFPATTESREPTYLNPYSSQSLAASGGDAEQHLNTSSSAAQQASEFEPHRRVLSGISSSPQSPDWSPAVDGGRQQHQQQQQQPYRYYSSPKHAAATAASQSCASSWSSDSSSSSSNGSTCRSPLPPHTPTPAKAPLFAPARGEKKNSALGR
ncbi:hypothetical protein HDU86_002401 [Geranomyces michiganensis]|nr:hypothetical protein HDU86_002401 [Geranomyces michiganensis]